MGMNTIWQYGTDDEVRQRFGGSLPYSPLSGYLEYGGSAYGTDDKPPIVNHHFDS